MNWSEQPSSDLSSWVSMGSLSAEPEERASAILSTSYTPFLSCSPRTWEPKILFESRSGKTLLAPLKHSIWRFPLVLQSTQQLLAWEVKRCDYSLSFPLHKGTGMYPLH